MDEKELEFLKARAREYDRYYMLPKEKKDRYLHHLWCMHGDMGNRCPQCGGQLLYSEVRGEELEKDVVCLPCRRYYTYKQLNELRKDSGYRFGYLWEEMLQSATTMQLNALKYSDITLTNPMISLGGE